MHWLVNEFSKGQSVDDEPLYQEMRDSTTSSAYLFSKNQNTYNNRWLLKDYESLLLSHSETRLQNAIITHQTWQQIFFFLCNQEVLLETKTGAYILQWLNYCYWYNIHSIKHSALPTSYATERWHIPPLSQQVCFRNKNHYSVSS